MKNIIRLTESDLHKIIKESVVKILNEDVNEDGTMTHKGQIFQYKGDFDAKQRKAWLAWRKQIDDAEARARGEEVPEPEKPKRTRKPKSADDAIGEDQASPKALALNVKKLVSDQALISVKGFISNGERQFGPNAIKTLVNIFKKEAGGKDLFVVFNRIYTAITETIEEIENWGRKNEYAVYERASKLANLLRDMDEILDEMSKVYNSLVNKKVIERIFGNNANVIMGNGHSLGLRSLIFAKSSVALAKVTGNLLYNASKLDEISKNGRNPFDYDPNNLRKKG